MGEYIKQYPTPSAPAIATYQYTDIEDGSGLVNYYLVHRNTSAGNTYHLTTSTKKAAMTLTAGNPDSGHTIGAGTTTLNGDIYNTARTVKGVASFSAKLTTNQAQTTSTISVKVQKVSGGTAVDISSEITLSPTTQKRYVNFEIPLTETYFAQGDNLRIIVTIVASGSSISCDPQATDYPSTIEIPFKIDL